MRNWELFDKGQIKLTICRDCGVWTAEVWDQKELKYLFWWACTPFRYDVGGKVGVKLQGNYNGLVGTIIRRTRMIKRVHPPPDPENYYFILFEKNQDQKDFREENLELHN